MTQSLGATALALLALALPGAAQTPGDSLPPPYLDPGLLSAWEEALRADSLTVRLEEIAPGRYSYATRRFPFDGELEVLHTSIDDLAAAVGGYDMGLVEVELVGLSDEFRSRYARSLDVWEQGHVLYRDEDGVWLGPEEFRERMAEDYASTLGWVGIFSSWLFPLFILGLVGGVIFLFRKMTRQIDAQAKVQDAAMKQYQDSITLARDSNAVLHEILETLREEREGGPPRD